MDNQKNMDNQNMDQMPSVEPQIQPSNSGHKKLTIGVVIGIVVLLGIAIYFLSMRPGGKRTLSEDKTLVQNTERQVPGEEIYRNEEFGFELQLNDAWKGYKVTSTEMSSNFGAGVLNFLVPTNSQIYLGEEKGFARVMIISVFNPEYWESLQKEEGPKPGLLGKNSNWVFAYSPWQDPPEDLVGKDFKLMEVVSSFKLIGQNETTD
jgi:hypothetical protein